MGRFGLFCWVSGVLLVLVACGGDGGVPVTTVADATTLTVAPQAPTTETTVGARGTSTTLETPTETTLVEETTEPEETTETTLVEETTEPEETTETTLVEETEPVAGDTVVVEETTEPETLEEPEAVEVEVPTVVAYEQLGPYPWEIPTLLTHDPEEVVWWYPDLMKDAFNLINPNSVGAVSWSTYHEAVADLTPDHSYYVFYHGGNVGHLRSAWRKTVEEEFMETFRYYYPVRYDVSQGEDAVIVVGTWPLGETWEIQVRESDGGFRGRIRDNDPQPPPLAPLPPFTEPDYPEFAEALGRDCPSVEVLWVKLGGVRDPCTLKALEQAVRYAVAAFTVEQSEAAIRDGWALRDVIQERKDLLNIRELLGYWYDPDNPGHMKVDIRYAEWGGTHAAASRIHLQFNLYHNPIEVTPEFRDKVNAQIRELLESGEDVHEIWLGEELPERVDSWWDSALMVRTADGTWRFSFTFWCQNMESTSFQGVEGKPLDCPEDPNPIWSDGFFDKRFPLPNSSYYWRSKTEAQRQHYGQPPP